MSQALGVNLEKTAREANKDFILTKEELMAIFLAHVPTSSDGYAEIKAAFQKKLDELDYKKINEDIEEQVKKGDKNPTIKIPVTVDIAGKTEVVPVEVTTNIDVTLNEQKVIKYDITHTVKINGTKVDKTPAAIQTEVDKVTGQLVSWFNNSTTGGDKLAASKQGAKYSATITDVSSDPIIQGGKVYEAKILGSDLAIKQGDHRNTLIHNRGIEVALTSVKAPTDGDQFMARTVSGGEAQMLDRFKYNYVALYDSSDQTYDLVTEV